MGDRREEAGRAAKEGTRERNRKRMGKEMNGKE